MQPETKLDLKKIVSEYLATVQSLSEEICGATAAIARNDLKALVGHIESQQKLSAQLLALDAYHPHLRSDPVVWFPILSALRKLAQHNRVYSALLAYSGRSQRILLTLCNAYNESCSHASGQSQDTPKLSCEV
jgi:hypothetical protein